MQATTRFSHLVTFFCFSLICFCLADDSERVTPPLNKDAMARVGGEMLHQGTIYQRAAIHLSEEITFGEEGAYALTPGYYHRTGESIGKETYAPATGPDAGRVKKAPGAITLQGSFLFSNDGKTIALITNFYQAVPAQAKGITRTNRPALSGEKIQRILIYGGKTGNKIKLAYREIWKNITRPAGDEFLEHDLSNSKIIEIKGARIEIMKATQDNVRYRITRGFDSSEK